MTSYPVSKTVATASQFYFRFRFPWLRSFGKVKIYPQAKSARYLNARLRYYYFRFLKTNVRHVRILLPVPIFTFPSPSAGHSASGYQILSKSDYPRQSCDVIYSFSRLRPRRRNSTSGFGFGKVEIYLRTKFWRNISIRGWDITTFGFWKQTSAMLEFYFRFRFLRLSRSRHIILHLPTKFRPNRITTIELWHHIHFSKWQPSAILNFLNVTADHPRSGNEDLRSVLKFRLDQIYSFGDIAFYIVRFWFEIDYIFVVRPYMPRMHRMEG